ncbi:hypothetical protein BaRGS_00021934 [Batillaria attramentaria]|uniref:Uncharacterized protein n=1 Tax=Batillaria attramentaria TaxID=370345 RepID=A0ABD0KIL2_9CAEN
MSIEEGVVNHKLSATLWAHQIAKFAATVCKSISRHRPRRRPLRRRSVSGAGNCVPSTHLIMQMARARTSTERHFHVDLCKRRSISPLAPDDWKGSRAEVA